MKNKDAFTLIELIVVIAVISILAALLLPALGRAKNEAMTVAEISAGKQLMIGVEMYAQDWNDALLPGYSGKTSATDDWGQPVGAPEYERYPWRIAPYMSGSIALIYSGQNASYLQSLQAAESSDSQAHFNYVYTVSLCPSLGINSVFIGGDDDYISAAQANAQFGPDTILTKKSGAKRPGDLMVFMSAQGSPSGVDASQPQPNVQQGWYRVLPPYIKARQWAASYSPALAPADWGQVAPRFNTHSVAALLDGHAEVFNLNQMQDMRHWCNRATQADWTLGN